jgi:hypothetical protein
VTDADQPTPQEAGASAAAEAAGVPAVREAEDRLKGMDVTGTPAGTHVATYDEVHAVLQDALADLDER